MPLGGDASRLSGELFAEVEKNWESCQVMQQRNTRDILAISAGKTATSMSSFLPAIDEYLEKLSFYNVALTDCREYEAWYRADVTRQSKETARILHEKQEAVEKYFVEVPQVVASLRDDLRSCRPPDGSASFRLSQVFWVLGASMVLLFVVWRLQMMSSR